MMMDDHHMMMMDHEKPVAVAPAAPVAPPAAATAEKTPKYLGKFSKTTHDVDGDIFLLDDHTIYIQGFSFDGQAPDVHFWSDGVAIPYYTRYITGTYVSTLSLKSKAHVSEPTPT